MSTATPATGRLAMAFGAFALVMIGGALAFQYIGGYPPCEMCHWQRWPHIAAAIIGIGGGLALQMGLIGRRYAAAIALVVLALIALSGLIGVYHAGVEWKWWAGPTACTGSAFRIGAGGLDLSTKVVMCDRAAWRLFGISMAGYNALLSIGAAIFGSIIVSNTRKLR